MAATAEIRGRARGAGSEFVLATDLFLTRTHNRLLRTGIAEIHGPPVPSKLSAATRAYETAIAELTRAAGLAA